MNNLEPIRAVAALKHATNLDRRAVNKLPAMILTNGLLATAAFCAAESEGDNRSGMKSALDATALHLAERRIIDPGTKDINTLIDNLSKSSSESLQRATAEALAFISYLKRFAQKKK